MDPASERERLAAGLDALGIAASTVVLDRLLAYRDLLARWNRVHNLTAVRDPQAMIAHHLLDSLSIHPYLAGDRILDLGTGAGLPGLPLALLDPERTFTLLDASVKRVRFLRQVVAALHVKNVEAVHARVENYRVAAGFATVTSRAFATLSRFADAALPLLEADGQALAMKGRFPQAELAELPAKVRVLAVHRLQVPGLEAQRHLVVLAPASAGNRANKT